MEEVEGSIHDGETVLVACTRLDTADGRSGPVVLLDAPTTEGDRVLHVLTGLGPLVR